MAKVTITFEDLNGGIVKTGIKWSPKLKKKASLTDWSKATDAQRMAVRTLRFVYYSFPDAKETKNTKPRKT